ncbi:MAG TPA: hypothetical protein VFW39_03580 [Sphingomicrobium sp.]|nr:hypothetical protein [Sphingomicrobium sp.]
MLRGKSRTLLIAGGAGALSIAAAQAPRALAPISGGLWEISGAPGLTAPVRQCIADVSLLAQFEHRGRNCAREIVSDAADSALIQYSCGHAGFGRSQIDVVTPRSLRISTQGVSGDLPFNYVLLARRVGDCPKSASVTRH